MLTVRPTFAARVAATLGLLSFTRRPLAGEARDPRPTVATRLRLLPDFSLDDISLSAEEVERELRRR